jgi:mono/diheme cytochrome c family protein
MKRPLFTLRWVIGALAVVMAAAALFVAVSWRPAIAPIAPPPLADFNPDLIRHGADLAAIGDCNTCHTAPGGKVFAGGLGLPTPFGTIYSTNITPDPETGIGRWSLEAFSRAMREGVDREGRHLYPAFPYDHFTLVSDADNEALYDYLMTRQPVKASSPANHLPFPLDIRLMLEGWKLLFLHEGPFEPDPTHDETWNRGAYLVEGLAHCGACHTPRNLLGAEEGSRFFAGGEAEGWHAFAINAASQSPVPWTVDALKAYLHAGWHGLHGVARGPMGPVVNNLAGLPEADIDAIAVYVASMMGQAQPGRARQGQALTAGADQAGVGSRPQSAGSQTVAPTAALASNDAGAAIYAGACATCHESGRPVPYGGLNLALSTAVSGESPRNLVNVILAGLAAQDGVRAPVMPNFDGVLSDQQIVALVDYLRAKASGKPAWTGVGAVVKDARASLGRVAATAKASAASSQ